MAHTVRTSFRGPRPRAARRREGVVPAFSVPLSHCASLLATVPSTPMRTRLVWDRDGERGQVLVIAALLMTALVGFLALVVDVGNAYAQRRYMQNAADAAALAAARLMANSMQTGTTDAAVSATINNYLALNGNGTFVPNAGLGASSGAWYLDGSGNRGRDRHVRRRGVAADPAARRRAGPADHLLARHLQPVAGDLRRLRRHPHRLLARHHQPVFLRWRQRHGRLQLGSAQHHRRELERRDQVAARPELGGHVDVGDRRSHSSVAGRAGGRLR